MIKNIIFDIGNVLVDFCWRELMDELMLTKEDKDRFETYVFGGKWWHHLDHGTMEEEEAVKHLREDNAEYAKAFDLVWKNRDKLVKPYDYSVSWIKGLQEQGYKVYLLSNYPEKLFTMHAENGSFPFLDLNPFISFVIPFVNSCLTFEFVIFFPEMFFQIPNLQPSL